MERAHARMVDTVAAADLQLRHGADGSFARRILGRKVRRCRSVGAGGETGERRVPNSTDARTDRGYSHAVAVALSDHYGGRDFPRGRGHAGRMVPTGFSRCGIAGVLRDLNV